MMTERCNSFTDSCAEIEFGLWYYSYGYEEVQFPSARNSIARTLVDQINAKDFISQDLDDYFRQLREAEVTDGFKIKDPLASVIVYVAPCTRLVSTAYSVCRNVGTRKSQLLEFSLRIDDRLCSSCSRNSKGSERLKQLVSSCREEETFSNPCTAELLKFLDLTWIEQRLYGLEGDEEAPTETRNIGHIFREESNKRPDEKLAAILVIGEEEEIVEIMNLLPLKRDPRVPRAREFFELKKSWDSAARRWTWFRKFVGRYTRNFRLEETRISSSPEMSSRTTPSTAGRPVTFMNTQTVSKKRKLSSQTSLESDDREEEDTEQNRKVASSC